MLEKVNMTSAHSLLFFDSPRRYAEILKILIGLKMLLELLAKTLFGVQLYFHASMQEFCKNPNKTPLNSEPVRL